MVPGKRVLVTRPAGQGSELAERLRALGADPLLIPSIATVEPSSFSVLDSALAAIGTFDWLVFTSANAVEVFARRRPAAVVDAQAAQASGRLRVAVIGAATGRALQSTGLKPDLIPRRAVAESLAEAMLPLVSQPGGRTRCLLVRAEEGREFLPDALRGAGAEVTVAPAYRTVVPDDSVQSLRAALAHSSQQPDAITFTSSSTARNLVAVCERADVAFPAAALRVSIGPITSRTLEELGLPAHAEAPEATIASLVETVMALLRAQETPGMGD